MAIDDNTSYELTGAQVKDLASKIKAKADSSSLATVATSGSYNDLLDKPTIPTVNDGTLTIQQNGTTVGTFTANQSSAATVSLTDTTYSDFGGATSGAAGSAGLVPAPAAGDEAKVLSGAGTWVNQSGGSTYTAGNGISISANDEISIDTSVVAELSDLPTVNNGTLTIQHNGTTKGTFTANQSTASTVNIETIYADDQIVTTPIDWSNILNHFYPVGSIYMSATLSTAAAVGDALGGTWVAWGAGRVPVGVDTSDADFDTAEETGGEKTHTLTATEIPSHNHKDLNWATDSYHTSIDSGTGNGVRLSMSGNDIEYIEGKFRTGYTGGGQAHNNLQPYITCYMYKRTA